MPAHIFQLMTARRSVQLRPSLPQRNKAPAVRYIKLIYIASAASTFNRRIRTFSSRFHSDVCSLLNWYALMSSQRRGEWLSRLQRGFSHWPVCNQVFLSSDTGFNGRYTALQSITKLTTRSSSCRLLMRLLTKQMTLVSTAITVVSFYLSCSVSL